MLAFDLHGVIMHLHPAMERYFKEHVGFALEENNNFSYPYPEWYDPRRFGPDIAKAIVMYGLNAKPMYGSIHALQDYKDGGYGEILIVTASAKSTMDTNRKWLDIHLQRDYTIHRVGGSENKLPMLLALGVTKYIDDRFRTCNQLAGHLEEVYLYNAGYNTGREPKEGVTRVNTLRQAIKLATQ